MYFLITENRTEFNWSRSDDSEAGIRQFHLFFKPVCSVCLLRKCRKRKDKLSYQNDPHSDDANATSPLSWARDWIFFLTETINNTKASSSDSYFHFLFLSPLPRHFLLETEWKAAERVALPSDSRCKHGEA